MADISYWSLKYLSYVNKLLCDFKSLMTLNWNKSRSSGLWRSVILLWDTTVSPWRWRQYGPLKRGCPTTTRHMNLHRRKNLKSRFAWSDFTFVLGGKSTPSLQLNRLCHFVASGMDYKIDISPFNGSNVGVYTGCFRVSEGAIYRMVRHIAKLLWITKSFWWE
jgi:hypothetical protein